MNTKNERKRIRQAEQVPVQCAICNQDTTVRRDTSKKYNRFTCSPQCKSKLISDNNSTKIDEDVFIQEYLKFKKGYQELAKDFNIGSVRARDILIKNNIQILSSNQIKKFIFDSGLGAWNRAEQRSCKNCNTSFKYRKASTVGYFCSHECYVKYSGRTSIEIKMSSLLMSLNIDFIEQYKLEKKYYDFYLPRSNTLIECDGNYWHSFEDAKKNDLFKNCLAIKNGYQIIRFTETMINKNIEQIKKIILDLEKNTNFI